MGGDPRGWLGFSTRLKGTILPSLFSRSVRRGLLRTSQGQKQLIEGRELSKLVLMVFSLPKLQEWWIRLMGPHPTPGPQMTEGRCLAVANIGASSDQPHADTRVSDTGWGMVKGVTTGVPGE